MCADKPNWRHAIREQQGAQNGVVGITHVRVAPKEDES